MQIQQPQALCIPCVITIDFEVPTFLATSIRFVSDATAKLLLLGNLTTFGLLLCDLWIFEVSWLTSMNKNLLGR